MQRRHAGVGLACLVLLSAFADAEILPITFAVDPDRYQ